MLIQGLHWNSDRIYDNWTPMIRATQFEYQFLKMEHSVTVEPIRNPYSHVLPNHLHQLIPHLPII